MKLHDTRSKQVREFIPLKQDDVRIYSCGPTVYDHIHIGNLSSFIFADTLQRAIKSGFPNAVLKHVMNFTDVDDKTIRRSAERYPDMDPNQALAKLTQEYADYFLEDMRRIGNDPAAYTFVKATDRINGMKDLVTKLHAAGFAYIADDGVYFSIAKYRESGKTYGQLLEITASNTSEARIQNDEYDKESVHDFALWKKHKNGEPVWEFELDGQEMDGRPGWHIECSVMSRDELGQPFDIHTGGIDLVFPHHENEIAQSTALESDPVMAQYFVHNEHLLVDGKKMSKSLNNFFTLQDIEAKGFDALAFRLLTLQAHYRNQTNFTWENLEAAQNRLKNWRAVASLRWQPVTKSESSHELAGQITSAREKISGFLIDDLDTPGLLAHISLLFNVIEESLLSSEEMGAFTDLLGDIDKALGLGLLSIGDIGQPDKDLIVERQRTRDDKNWTRSDELRDELANKGLGIRDTPHGSIWYRL